MDTRQVVLVQERKGYPTHRYLVPRGWANIEKGMDLAKLLKAWTEGEFSEDGIHPDISVEDRIYFMLETHPEKSCP